MLFEIHITSSKLKLDLSWKELVIELNQGDTLIQPMYSKYIRSDSVLDVVNNYIDIDAERLKIEQCSELPEFVKSPKYYEYHIKVANNDPDLYLQDISARLSKNAQKSGRFITLRGYYIKSRIDKRFELLIERIKEKGYTFSNIQRELVVYDSNINLDNGW